MEGSKQHMLATDTNCTWSLSNTTLLAIIKSLVYTIVYIWTQEKLLNLLIKNPNGSKHTVH